MATKNYRRYLKENYPEYLVLSPDYFDRAIVGVIEGCGTSGAVCYSVSEIIEILMKIEKMSEEDAWEWYDYNIAGAYMGKHTPVFLTKT